MGQEILGHFGGTRLQWDDDRLQWRRTIACEQWSGPGFVTNQFDVVAVRTNDESCVVVGVVVRPQTGPAIVFATRFQCRAIEGVDLLAILRHERQVKMRRLLLGLADAQ
jgi:hypothetical protein